MNTSLYKFSENVWTKHTNSQSLEDDKAELVLCFGSKTILEIDTIYSSVKSKFSSALISMCSTAGEIYQDNVYSDTLVAVAISFNKTTIEAKTINIKDYNDSYNAGIGLVKKIAKENLAYLMVFSDGSLVNGSELVKGMSSQVNKDVLITGGLALQVMVPIFSLHF
jgi:hypothetical protein